ncbi:MAG: WG repeat-containing protein [Alistipes senegalensis]|nr:WG repeat-containing protein [Alistipes senegalensis]
MKKSLFKCLLLGLLMSSTTSCDKHGSMPEITHLPFKAAKSDNWGLIGTDGTVLFEDEFYKTPSAVVNGVFRVENSDGRLQYFTIGKTPKAINNKSYIAGGFCTEDLIPVVTEEEGISFLKKNGDIAFIFEEYEGVRITAVNSYFSDGLCLFKTEDNKYGYIDTEGHVVIQPKYRYATPFCEGIAVVDDETKYTFGSDFNIIDIQGEKIAKLNTDMTADKIVSSYNLYSDGLLYFGGKVFDRKGEVAFRLLNKIDGILPYHHGFAVFEDEDDNYGLLNNKGEIVVRAKYDEPGHVTKDRAFFVEDETETECIDFNGERIFKSEYPIIPVADNRCIIRTKKEFYFADYNGTPLDKNSYSYILLPSAPYPNLFLAYVHDRNWSCTQWVHSDYYDAEAHIASVLNKLNKKGIENIEMGMSILELKKYYDMGSHSNSAYKYWGTFNGITGSGNLKTTYKIHFTDWMADYSGYNRDALVGHVIINLDWDDVTVTNAGKRIREAIPTYLENIGFYRRGHTDDWEGEAWDIYMSNHHDYLIAVSEDGQKLTLEKNS